MMTGDEFDAALAELMELGLVEQLVGEDGKFYYCIPEDKREEVAALLE